MKTHTLNTIRRANAGFTLIELVIVITIIAVLAALTLGIFEVAQNAAAKSKTTSMISVIQDGLERYNTELGGYPSPKSISGSTGVERNESARCLYQALTGDGDDYIDLGTPGTNSSNGKIGDPVSEKRYSFVKDLSPKNYDKVDYYLVDGWDNPFQYRRYKDAADRASKQVNTATFDVWSYGNYKVGDYTGDPKSGGTLENANKTIKWIKNF